MNEEFKSGFVAVIGRPNVGKSTLINTLIGQKIAIMSDKPQTTRQRILCVLNLPNAQAIFIDTPGIHKPKHKLGEYMMQAAEGSLKEVDAVLLVVDATEKRSVKIEYILERLRQAGKPVILALNKLDLIDKTAVLPLLEEFGAKYDFAAMVPISAQDGINLDNLLSEIRKLLPPGPKYYPDDMITDQPERLIIAELIREKILFVTQDEIPHVIAVMVEEMTKRRNNDTYIRAEIYVERDSQKGIIIGKRGARLKEIAQAARVDIEALLEGKVFLDLWVKVKRDWRNKASLLHELGLDLA